MSETARDTPWPTEPLLECDVVLKGGVTSGVIYPRALSELGRTYRLRGIGGSSAGAIGAALGAAAEFHRRSGNTGPGGYAALHDIPARVDLRRLFRPQRSTAPLLPVITAATGFTSDGRQRTGAARVLGILAALVRSSTFAVMVGLLPGLAIVVAGALSVPPQGALLIVCGVVIAILGVAIAVGLRLFRIVTHNVPQNLFGICTGYDENDADHSLTGWLSDRLNEIAGLTPADGPLRFGHLYSGSRTIAESAGARTERAIDLRMMSTCLSRSRPYEMPFTSASFLYDPVEWSRLFPADVMAALDEASRPDEDAAAHTPPLRRLPDAAELPVIVAVRMSLSAPLLISAVPLWGTDWRRASEDQVSTAAGTGARKRYEKLWFSDGGLTSNFPVYLFDAALPSRPTFAINLGRFEDDRGAPHDDQRRNVVFARSNSDELLPPYRPLPEKGVSAIVGFGAAAFDTARNWYDNSHLDAPGYRDRIVRVLQTKGEGGLNLGMSPHTIDLLAERGRVAAEEITAQFTERRYPSRREPKTHSGWDNHRWVRYRALLAGMPEFLAAVARGHALLDVDADSPPSYEFKGDAADVADLITTELLEAAREIADASPVDLEYLTESPSPSTVIRRVPRV